MKEKRNYTLRKRAATQEETRTRIVEATMALHEELGPRATTISAIAERAGVQRLTVYRHFPDDTAVFQACTSHWLSLNPPPDPAQWLKIEDGAQRVRAALSRLYAYYRRTARMWEVSFRDVADVPALQQPMQGVRDYLRALGDGLLDGMGEGAPAPAQEATVRHALAYATWASLAEQGLEDSAMVDLVLCWIDGLGTAKKDPAAPGDARSPAGDDPERIEAEPGPSAPKRKPRPRR